MARFSTNRAAHRCFPSPDVSPRGGKGGALAPPLQSLYSYLRGWRPAQSRSRGTVRAASGKGGTNRSSGGAKAPPFRGWHIRPDAPCRDVCDPGWAAAPQMSHLTQIAVGALLFRPLQADSTWLIVWRLHHDKERRDVCATHGLFSWL